MTKIHFLILSGKQYFRFTVNWRCGCVISEKAIEEVKPDVCHGCGGPFNKNDLIILNPPQDVLEIYKKLEEERLKRKLSKASSQCT